MSNNFYNSNNNFFNNSNNHKGTNTMKNSYGYNNNDLDTMNPAPRCPVTLLLDTSSSMDGQPIQELNAALCQFIKETSEDEAASMSVELEVITFDDAANIVLPFTPISNVRRNSVQLNAYGMTSMGAALGLAKTELETRRRMYRNSGISSYRPWVILMTDGGPNDNWRNTADQMRKLAEAGKITYIGIEIGNCADHGTMCQILPADPGPVKLQGLKFKQFFKWLTDSLKSISSSAVSDQDNVKLGSIRSWADLAGI